MTSDNDLRQAAHINARSAEADAEIARLKKEVERLRAALKKLTDHFTYGREWSGPTRGDTITAVERFAAAALAAWPGALCAPPDSWTRHKRDAASLILPLQETP
jgi:hypothetical protein